VFGYFMKANSLYGGLTKDLNRIAVLILSGLIDLGFVLVWIVTQLLVGRFVVRSPLISSLAPGWILVAFQVIFAISTLVPVALYLARDVAIGIRRWAQTRKGIKRR
jgi:uncharacterized membrane protein